MKFLPTIDLWNPAIAAAVRSGQLKLLPGQWVRCGSDKLSRWVCMTPGSMWATHWQGSGAATLAQWKRLLEAAKCSGYIPLLPRVGTLTNFGRLVSWDGEVAVFRDVGGERRIPRCARTYGKGYTLLECRRVRKARHEARKAAHEALMAEHVAVSPDRMD